MPHRIIGDCRAINASIGNGNPKAALAFHVRVGQAKTLDPQPQIDRTFGLLITNCAPSKPIRCNTLTVKYANQRHPGGR